MKMFSTKWARRDIWQINYKTEMFRNIPACLVAWKRYWKTAHCALCNGQQSCQVVISWGRLSFCASEVWYFIPKSRKAIKFNTHIRYYFIFGHRYWSMVLPIDDIPRWIIFEALADLFSKMHQITSQKVWYNIPKKNSESNLPPPNWWHSQMLSPLVISFIFDRGTEKILNSVNLPRDSLFL